jgi:lipopolysaccharide biosynthesis protein
VHTASLFEAVGASAVVDDAEPRLIAFYLPQFHRIPENDAWWGRGFTEWTNVTKAQSLFPGHYQPHLPGELGFYDLRLPSVREAQAELAADHGIHGFCYYHYWFHGKRLLETPFEEVLRTGGPAFPFCLCWANEPWSRRWDGRNHDILQAQTYSREDDRNHLRALIPALSDRRAIHIDGKPVFIVYQARDLPEPERTAEIWRQEARRAGLPELYLMTVETGWDEAWDATKYGFDAKVLFQPQFSLLDRMARMTTQGPLNLAVYDYQQAWLHLADSKAPGYTAYPTVFPGWDNSPRKGEQGHVLHNSTPEAYETWLRRSIEKVRVTPEPSRRVIFINAWNEWGEGCHLEPDLKHGRAYLEATKRALKDSLPRPSHRAGSGKSGERLPIA